MSHVFAERLRQAREERGMTVIGLAEQSEMSRTQVQNYEHGRRSPTIDCLVRLAKSLDCTTDFLVGLE